MSRVRSRKSTNVSASLYERAKAEARRKGITLAEWTDRAFEDALDDGRDGLGALVRKSGNTRDGWGAA